MIKTISIGSTFWRTGSFAKSLETSRSSRGELKWFLFGKLYGLSSFKTLEPNPYDCILLKEKITGSLSWKCPSTWNFNSSGWIFTMMQRSFVTAKSIIPHFFTWSLRRLRFNQQYWRRRSKNSGDKSIPLFDATPPP